MAIRVLVIGQHAPAQVLFEDVAGRVGPDTSTFITLRCRTPGELFDKVRDAVWQRNAPISVLDLCDHGGDGYIRMGDPIEPPLFAAPDIGKEVASALADLLTFDAHVRLLGCDTAVASKGRALLLMLSNAFNQQGGKAIVVSGTLKAVNQGDFDVGGFKMAREEHYLFSSTEAIAVASPTFDERALELLSWRRRIGLTESHSARTHRIPIAKSR